MKTNADFSLNFAVNLHFHYIKALLRTFHSVLIVVARVDKSSTAYYYKKILSKDIASPKKSAKGTRDLFAQYQIGRDTKYWNFLTKNALSLPTIDSEKETSSSVTLVNNNEGLSTPRTITITIDSLKKLFQLNWIVESTL